MRVLFAWLILLLLPYGYTPPIVRYPVDSDVPVCQAFGHLKHVGVDFNVPVGTRIYSVLSGFVIVAVEDSRTYGRFALIQHEDGYATLYGHLSRLFVRTGDWVNGGEVIGLSGGDPRDRIDGDGQSTGAHLHFEVRHPDHLDSNLYNVDPIKWLNRYLNDCYYGVGKYVCN